MLQRPKAITMRTRTEAIFWSRFCRDVFFWFIWLDSLDLYFYIFVSLYCYIEYLVLLYILWDVFFWFIWLDSLELYFYVFVSLYFYIFCIFVFSYLVFSTFVYILWCLLLVHLAWLLGCVFLYFCNFIFLYFLYLCIFIFSI